MISEYECRPLLSESGEPRTLAQLGARYLPTGREPTGRKVITARKAEVQMITDGIANSFAGYRMQL